MTLLEHQFHEAMLDIYEAAGQLSPPYRPTRFRQMVLEHGGKAAADALLATQSPSEGFTILFERGNRLDLSVEYLVLTAPYRGLFTDKQLETARARLELYEFNPPGS